jgi:putative CocE/NonD family hydrolase
VIAHETYDTFWQNASVEVRHASVEIPIYHSGGWYDIFLEGTLNFFAALQAAGADPAARGNQKVVIGPWTHSGQDSYQQGELTYPSNSVIADDETQRMLQWFDYWLKGEANGIMDLPPVRYYVMGDVDDATGPGNEWWEAAEWPVSATPSVVYLGSDGRLIATPPGVGDPPDSFVYDPDSPVPTIGGANLKIPAGPYDQRPAESRSDVLVFTSSALTEPLEIVGPVTVVLHGSSTALDTDWVVRLCDVYPDGRSMLVTDGIRRAKFRDSYQTAALLTPGEIYEFEIDLWPTAIAFNTGHRIRIDVSSSNDPRFDPNPNTGDPLHHRYQHGVPRRRASVPPRSAGNRSIGPSPLSSSHHACRVVYILRLSSLDTGSCRVVESWHS